MNRIIRYLLIAIIIPLEGRGIQVEPDVIDAFIELRKPDAL